jgi:uncharacterized membrane protein
MEREAIAAPQGHAPDSFDMALHWVAMLIEGAGVAIIVLGALVALVISLRQLVSGDSPSAAYHQFRTTLGRGILLGLELLVAADIIGTVAVEPTLQNLSVLALIVLIRTFLSVSLSVEIDGRWPWQKASLRTVEGAKAQ